MALDDKGWPDFGKLDLQKGGGGGRKEKIKRKEHRRGACAHDSRGACERKRQGITTFLKGPTPKSRNGLLEVKKKKGNNKRSTNVKIKKI